MIFYKTHLILYSLENRRRRKIWKHAQVLGAVSIPVWLTTSFESILNTNISLKDTFKTVAELLELETLDTPAKKLKSIKTIVQMVHDYFKYWECVLIFDNCFENTKTGIVEFLSTNHSTIITS